MIARFEILDAVAADARVSPAAFRLFYVLVTRFLNRKTGEAWPAHKTLANILNVDERQVRRLMIELTGAGYLLSKRGGSGRPNRYSLALTDRTKMSGEEDDRPDKNVLSEHKETGQKCPVSDTEEGADRTKMSAVTGQKCPPNPIEEPLEENISPKPPSSKRPRKPSSPRTEVDAVLDALWAIYPRREDKGTARKALAKALKTTSAETILAGVRVYAAQRRGEDPKFTKLPATWLNAEGWNNEPSSQANGAASIDDPSKWPRSKWETAIAFAKERRAWSPAYGSPANIPRDLLDAELNQIIAGRAA